MYLLEQKSAVKLTHVAGLSLQLYVTERIIAARWSDSGDKYAPEMISCQQKT